MNEIIIAVIGLLGGGTLQYLISTKFMPKKDEKESDAHFIDTLIQRVTLLEGRIEQLSAQISSLMASNATLSVELNYIKEENIQLKNKKDGK